jgi:hypothetical protein
VSVKPFVAHSAIAVSAAEGDDGAVLEFDSRAYERHLQSRRVLVVAHQQVGDAQRYGIGGSCRRNTQVRVTRSSAILKGGKEARLGDAYGHPRAC